MKNQRLYTLDTKLMRMIKEIIQSVQRVRLFDVTPYLLIPHTVSCEEEATENKRSRLKKRIKYQFCCNFH